MTNEIIARVTEEVKKQETRGAWSKGVTKYALELLENLDEAISGGYFDPEQIGVHAELEDALLNGARDWSQFSWGGCSLIYDADIAERLCNPSELKKTRHGERRPNAREEWLDTQARALYQAFIRIWRAVSITAA